MVYALHVLSLKGLGERFRVRECCASKDAGETKDLLKMEELAKANSLQRLLWVSSNSAGLIPKHNGHISNGDAH